MLVSGSFFRASIAFLYLLIFTSSTALTYFFFSEPALFIFILSTVSLLVLSYPALCLIAHSRSYDLEVRSPCQMEWMPISVDIESCQSKSEKELSEKPSKLDVAFTYAYM